MLMQREAQGQMQEGASATGTGDAASTVDADDGGADVADDGAEGGEE